ncbi:hypothetical protein PZA11_002422 [Diplocarpon coronariae]|uniref:Cupin type-2 domain-containing protein n=1 Tax=Diplocarpon coronariae TaxID=2795749 RepID=A0A218ZDR3_9HELO|nr:cupin domain protein [Diplocarpon mali]OWP05415.1 hypothetical protein B2J93_8358 [Marssonina coronariae]
MTLRPSLPAEEPTYDASRPFPSLLPLYNYPIPNIPGKSVVVVQVTFPPNGSTPPHTHPGAFVVGYVVSGYVFNARNKDPMEIKGPGENFTEHPGCRHRISNNASDKAPAVLIATFVVDTEIAEAGMDALVVIDEEYRELVREAQEKTGADRGRSNRDI